MHHPAELKLHQYMTDAANGKTEFSPETAMQVGSDVAAAIVRQFGSGKSRDEFRLRMSNIGRPTCQLWFDKNKPETALPKPSTFVMNMMIGDIVEAVFKGILTEAGVSYDDTDTVSLPVEGGNIKGSYDIVIDDAVDDIKSASPWSYTNKFDSFDSLSKGDSFGYVGQLAGYAKGLDKKAGGWWVVNKANGNFKYVEANELDIDEEITTLQDKVQKLDINEFERSFEAVPEYYRKKPTGNTVLNSACKFCDYKRDCYKSLVTRPSIPSTAKEPPEVDYVHIEEKYND